MKNVNKPSTSIKDWAKDDQPREKLMSKGPEALSNTELIAILLQAGRPEKNVLEIAKEVMLLGGNNLSELGKVAISDFRRLEGIGKAKAIMLAAVMELGRRRHSHRLSFSNRLTVHSSKDIAHYLRTLLKDNRHEMFAVVFLNKANRVKHFEVISKGGITGTVADPKVILKKALEQEASAVIICHNHPSGNLQPSRADEVVTRKIAQALKYLDMRLLDHIIVSDDGYYSFADSGNM